MKKIICGILCLFLFSPIVYSQKNKPQTQVLKTEKGRYVFGQLNEYGTSTYMLDTQTGRLWKLYNEAAIKNSDNKELTLLEIPYKKNDDKKHLDMYSSIPFATSIKTVDYSKKQNEIVQDSIKMAEQIGKAIEDGKAYMSNMMFEKLKALENSKFSVNDLAMIMKSLNPEYGKRENEELIKSLISKYPFFEKIVAIDEEAAQGEKDSMRDKIFDKLTKLQKSKISVDDFAMIIKTLYPASKDKDNVELAKYLISKNPSFEKIVVFKKE